MGEVASGIGGLIGGGKDAAQGNQQASLGSNLANQEGSLLSGLGSNFMSTIAPMLLTLAGSGIAGQGPIGALSGLGTQAQTLSGNLANANVFPSAGTSAMKTLISQIGGGVANPGSVIENTSGQVAQAGMAGQIGGEQAAIQGLGTAGNLESGGISSIIAALTGAGGPLSSAISTGGNLSSSLTNSANTSFSNAGTAFGAGLGDLSSPGAFGALAKAA